MGNEVSLGSYGIPDEHFNNKGSKNELKFICLMGLFLRPFAQDLD
jgi:hypothetical protein